MCLVELVGPSRFDHWAEGGVPVGVPHPQAWVQVTAVNQSQTRNTMTLLPGLMSQHFKDVYRIKDGAELIRANGGKQRLEAVTSSYRALEGGRITFTLLNETHHWIRGNNGHKMYETIDGNATKKDARYLAITNAYLPGEDSVAERMRGAWERITSGRAADVGFLYDSIEAHPETPLTPEALRVVIPKIRGDAVWLNIDAIIASVLDTTLSPSRSRRMWLNQIVAEEDALYGPQHWTPLVREDAVLRKGDKITVGFDGGKTDDATALVALRVADQCGFVLALEEKPHGPQGDGWEVDRTRVDSAVHEMFRLYDVQAFFADVELWESYIDDWAEKYGERLVIKATEKHSIAWDMRGSLQRTTRAHERLMAAVKDAKLGVDDDADLRRHFLNVRRRDNNYGTSFGKESRESPRKVDLYAALMLAYEAFHMLRTSKYRKPKQRTGHVWAM